MRKILIGAGLAGLVAFGVKADMIMDHAEGKEMEFAVESTSPEKLMEEAYSLVSQKKPEEACKRALRAAKLFDSQFGRPNPASWKALELTAIFNKGTDADTIMEVCSRLADESPLLFGEISKENAEAKRLMGVALVKSKDYERALPYFNEAVEINKTLGDNADAFENHLAERYLLICLERLKMYEHILEIRRDNLAKMEATAPDSEDYLIALEYYGDALHDTEQFTESTEVKKRCADLAGKLYGTDSKEYARSLYGYSLAAYLGREYNNAKEAALKAVTLGEKLLTPANENYLKNKLEIAKIYTTYQCYADAARIGHELLVEFSNLDPLYLRDISSYLKNNDEFTDAEELLDIAISKLDPNIDKERIQYYIAICSKSNYLSETGRYMDAINLIENEIANVSPEERVYQLLLTNLSGLYQSIGNIRQCALLSRKHWEKINKESGMEMPDAVRKELECEEKGIRYQPTAEDYAYLIKETEAFLEDLKSQGMAETEDYASELHTLAGTFLLSKDYDKGLDAIDKAITIIKNIKGDHNSDYADYLELKGMLLYGREKYTESYPLFEKAKNINKDLYGSGHQSYISSLRFLALNASKVRHEDTAVLTKEVAGEMDKSVREAFVSLSPTERNMYWDNKSNWYTVSLPSITYKNPHAGLEGILYDGVLLSKGVLLNTELEQTALLKSCGSTEINDIYFTLHSLRKKLSDSKSLSAHDRDSIEQKAVGLERELTSRSKEFGDYTKSMSYTWKDVEKNLLKDDTAIEFVEIPTENDSVVMSALVLRKGYEKPKLIEIKDPASPWKYLKDNLVGVKRIYFSPAGPIYSFPIEYLPEITEFTGIDKTEIYRVSSTRAIIPGSVHKEGTGALIYGDIAYDLDFEDIVADMKENTDSNERFRGNDNPLILEDTERGAQRGYPKLPETRTEVNAIYSILGGDKDPQIVLKTGKEATEAGFKKNVSAGFGTIHLATHGYYLNPQDKAINKLSNLEAEADALKRCGLIMAGANSALRNKNRVLNENIDDGALTGEEISRLDLRGVDFVSLSACETGLGDQSYDGVMGLQRGFKKAGVKSLLMSLRKVNDNAASIFMTEFYRSLSERKNKIDALASARKALSEYTDDNGNRPYDSPKYLDAFILLDGIRN